MTLSLHGLPLRAATATIKSQALYTASGTSLTTERQPGNMDAAKLSITELSNVSFSSIVSFGGSGVAVVVVVLAGVAGFG